MKDLYLRAANEAALFERLIAAGLASVVDGQSIPHDVSRDHALSVVGQIPGDAGYHANLRLLNPRPDIESTLAEVVIQAPTTAAEVWA